jgi:hypothetical protein
MNAAEFRCKREYLGLELPHGSRVSSASTSAPSSAGKPEDGKVPDSRSLTGHKTCINGAAKAVSYLTVQQFKLSHGQATGSSFMPGSQVPSNRRRHQPRIRATGVVVPHDRESGLPSVPAKRFAYV